LTLQRNTINDAKVYISIVLFMMASSINKVLNKKIYSIKLRKMLKSALKALVKKTNLEMLYWKMVKRYGFDFLKVKKLLNSIQTYYF